MIKDQIEYKWLIRVISLLVYAFILAAIGVSVDRSLISKKEEILKSDKYASVIKMIKENDLDARKVQTAFRTEHSFAEAYFGAFALVCILIAPYTAIKYIIQKFINKMKSPKPET